MAKQKIKDVKSSLTDSIILHPLPPHPPITQLLPRWKVEINSIPSQLNISPVSGVASQLAQVAQNQPQFDGITIDQMRGNPLFQRVDDIDKIGLAQKAIIETTKTVKSNAARIRQFNAYSQKVNIPTKSSK